MNPAAVFLIVATTSQYQYDDHTFALENNTSSFVLINDSGFFPSYQEDYVIQNIGRSPIQAELWYGDEVQWFGVVCGATIKPGERKELDNEGKLYYYTGLKITNNNKERAIFHGDGGDVYSPYTPGVHFDMFKYLRKTFSSAVKYIPINSTNIFEGMISAFWPDKQLNVWTDILNQISPMFYPETTEVIGSSIESNLNKYKSKFENLGEKEPKETYMTIALESVNLEEKFMSDIAMRVHLSKIMSADILPIYSNIISMKMHFYLLGIRYKDKLGLSEEDLQTVRGYASKTFKNASDHILNVSDGMVDFAYNYSEAPNIFNNMMTIRSHLTIHGFEYIPIWKDKLENPTNNNEIYNSVVSYSTFHGKPTPNLYAQSTSLDVLQPLNPLVSGEKKILLTRMTIYLWLADPYTVKIGGAKVFFNNGREYLMGTETPITENFDLEGAQILQLSVFGVGKIDGLKFYLSNNLIKSFGTVNSTAEDFKLPDHYISSFYISSDDADLNGQAANIAVSYQWYVQYQA